MARYPSSSARCFAVSANTTNQGLLSVEMTIAIDGLSELVLLQEANIDKPMSVAATTMRRPCVILMELLRLMNDCDRPLSSVPKKSS